MTRHALVVLALVLALTAAAARGDAQEPGAARGPVAPRNPPAMRAVQLDAAGRPSSRVRFEWAPVAGAEAYLLTGEWVTRQSWAKHAHRVRVTPESALRWTRELVSIELTLPAGTHSWKLVAVSGPDDLGDFERPTQLPFEVR